MASISPQFFELMETRQLGIFFTHLTMIEELFSQLFQRKPSSKAYEDRIRVAGFGTLVTKREGEPITFDDPVQGTRIRTLHAVYALGWRATQELMDDEQHGVMDQMSADLGKSVADHRERIAFNFINSAATSTVLENENLASTTHTNIKDGATQSNDLSPAVDLSTTGLETIMNLAMTTTSEEGRFIRLMPKILLIHPNLQHRAYELLQTEFKVDSADNNRNTIASSRSGLRTLEVPYLTNTDGWSVHAAPGENGLTWYDRREPTFRQAPDADTEDRKHYALYRAHATGNEWRGNWFSRF